MSIYTNTLSNNIAALTTTRFETSIQNDRIYEIDKYLSEIQHLLMRMLLSESKTFILNSPTGTGKNDTFLYLISELKKKFKKKKFVTVYPSNLSNEAKTEEYSNSKNNWRQLEMNILSIDQYTDATTKANIGSLIHDADVIHIVANSYKYIAPYVDEDWVFIVDEVHKATTQHQIAPLDEYQQIINSPATKILMTGTLFDSFKQEFDFPTIYVARKENPKINAHCCEIVNAKGKCLRYNFKNRLRHLENAAMNFIPTLEKKGKVHIIYIQDKNAIDRLADYTEKMGMRAAKIYSSDEIRNNSKIYNYLVNGQPIPMSKDDDSIVIISTSLSYDSINLNNEHEQIGKIAVFGEEYTQNVRQLVARPRKAKELDVYYFRLKRPQTKKYTKTYAQFRAECQKVVGEYHKLVNALLKIKTGLEMASEGADEFSLLAKANTELKKIIPYATFRTVKDIKYKLKNLTKNKNHLPHDITGLLTSTGEVNVLKIIALYEQEKTKYETNQQKFDELAKHFDVIVQDIKLKEIGQLLGNNQNAEEMAEKNKETIEAVIEADKMKKAEAKELTKSLIHQNLFFTLGLYLDRDIERNRNTDVKLGIEEILKNKLNIKNDKDYQAFKKQIPNLQDRLFFKNIRIVAKRAKRISRDFEINEASLKNESFTNLFTCSKAKYHEFLEVINATRAIKNDCNSEYDSNIKTIINVEMYKRLYEKFEVGQSYTRNQIHEICHKVYGKFTHKPIRKRDSVRLIEALFDTTETQITVYDDNGGKSRVRHLHFDAKNTYEKALQKYGIAGWQRQLF